MSRELTWTLDSCCDISAVFHNPPLERFSLPPAAGGLGFIPLTDIKAAFTVSCTCLCLNSKHGMIAQMIQNSVRLATNKPTLEDALDYIMSGQSYGSSSNKFITRCCWSNLNLAIKQLLSFLNISLRVVNDSVECYAGLFGSQMLPLPAGAIFHNLCVLLGQAACIELTS